jgi:uncharacterized protein YidB (DUF937 family)
MGLLDMVEQMAGGASGGDNAKVAGGLMEEIQSRPGGISEVLQSFHQNGMTGLVQQWAGGQTQAANPGDIESGLGSTGIVDSIAQRTGLPASAVTTGLAVIVPVLIKHMASNGHVTPDGQPTGSTPDAGGLLQSVLGHIL